MISLTCRCQVSGIYSVTSSSNHFTITGCVKRKITDEFCNKCNLTQSKAKLSKGFYAATIMTKRSNSIKVNVAPVVVKTT